MQASLVVGIPQASACGAAGPLKTNVKRHLMNKEELAYVGCKLVALYLAITSVISLISNSIFIATMEISGDQNISNMAYLSLITPLLYILVCLCLWFGAKPLTQFILGEVDYELEAKLVSARDIQTIAFSAIGLFILLNALPELGGIFHQAQLEEDIYGSETGLSNYRVELFVISIKAILGMLLFLGARGLSGIILRLKTFGSK